MVTEILATELVKQLMIAVPSIVLGTQTITASLKGICKIENPQVNRAVSWVVAILVGLGFVAFNGLSIVSSPVWVNYAFGAVAGFLAGVSANGFYDLGPIWSVFNTITSVFGSTRIQSTVSGSTSTNESSEEEISKE